MAVKVRDKIRIIADICNRKAYQVGEVYTVESVSSKYRFVFVDESLSAVLFDDFEVISGEIEDMVNQPSHYTQGKVECIDAIEAAVTGLVGMEAVNTSQVIKYVWRWKHKNGLEDLEKAKFYLDKLIEEVRQGE